MNSFYVISGKKVKRIFFIIVAALFAAGVVVVESDNITVFSEGSPSAIYSVPTDKKVVALTFDISWGETRAQPILDILSEKKLDKATFFLSSPWSKTHPEIVRKMVDAGYEIGSHGHKHVNYSSLNDEEIKKQISTAHTILSELTGKQPNLIRMPNGDFDKRVLKIANQMNYKVIQWDTDSQDWKNPGVDTIVKRVVDRAHNGDIILLHASDSCKQTHLALPAIIDQLRAKGYEFVTVSELIQQTELNNKAIQDTTIQPIQPQPHVHDAAGA
ncbi:polysaccharide deacetylase family sporulation protein PdaB [Paenibacillus sp. SC116]|uniref:polysaccharide deacetylase family sporulation protein PdaB n=1 Tax=Paenibacillus sp. SC116 TaxID=2968986 RepID=UPI00215A4B41|nr:polysaccharide deacetylase family sporulation protein PdaB [Paenibacillus sp. SC116]MCR8846748.1 polysaccharide deacetylase family sporulation protein PdaB [Paenibacillus sp. SC116]